MVVGPWLQGVVFGLFALISVLGALGMATTMSMFRSGVFLMGSFVGVAGLFVLLLADLVALLQVMMYVGGMLVMILFMVLWSHDPGGEMMTRMMKLPLVERLFSAGLAHGGGEGGGQHADMDMDMEEMSMFTPVKRQAAALALVVGALLLGLVLARPAFPVAEGTPDPDAARRVGELLMHRYMLAFEGAGLLILLGIFGSVLLSRPAEHPDARDRAHLRAAVDERPAPADAELPAPDVTGPLVDRGRP